MSDARRLMEKAERASHSARLLLANGDPEGACNRAYYAMFDAACAALTWRLPGEPHGKSHAGLINAFSLHFVKTRLVPKDLGRALKRGEELRLIADYRGESVGVEDVILMIASAEAFIAALKALMPRLDAPPQ